MEWHKIFNQNDINDFMNKFGYFHDGCIKEVHYISGAYVSEDLSMMPINDKRILKVVFQRQWKDLSAIEIEFSGLIHFNLKPVDKNYTCEIFEAYMQCINEVIYWADDSEWDINAEDKNEYTWVAARYVQWREANDYLGDKIIYKQRM